MASTNALHVAVFAGDGIGHEVTPPCLELMQRALAATGGAAIDFESLPAGAICYRDTGVALPPASLQAARKADAILLAAMGWPDIRYPDGTEIAPQVELRFELELFAGLRPVRPLPGLAPVLADPRASQIDFVLIRESTEGLFASFGQGRVIGDERAEDTQVITRAGSERLFDFAFKLAQKRRAAGHAGRVTCVDKANIFASFAFFRRIFEERAKAFPEIAHDSAYVDAMAMRMLQRPWEFDVVVTENMFGDILSDLGAGLIGGLGFAPSADIGEKHAVFQPCHGTAPDIAGQGKANPTAMLLSGAMMLEWLGEEHGLAETAAAGRLMRDAVDHAFATRALKPFEIGGSDGTGAIAQAVLDALAELR